MFNVRLAGGHLYGKQLFTWLSLVVSFMASFVLSFFPLDVLDGIWDLIESVSEGFLPTYGKGYYRGSYNRMYQSGNPQDNSNNYYSQRGNRGGGSKGGNRGGTNGRGAHHGNSSTGANNSLNE